LHCRLRTPEAYAVLLSVGALIVISPLRYAFSEISLIPFFATLSLFVVLGVLISHYLLNEYASGPTIVPVSFAISASIFGLLGIPVLILHRSVELYLCKRGQGPEDASSSRGRARANATSGTGE
jgi:hypothetical protein